MCSTIPQIEKTWAGKLFPYFEELNRDVSRNIRNFICPSDPRGGVTYASSGFGSTGYGLTWYVPLDEKVQYPDSDNMGVIVADIYTYQPTPYASYYKAPVVRILGVTDGTSNTVMLSERPPSIAGTYSDLFWGWYAYQTSWDTRTTARGVSGLLYYSSGGYGAPNVTTCPVPAVTMPFSLTNQCAFNAPSSFHTGGFLNIMADGSIKFLTYSAANGLLPAAAPGVAQKSLFQALATRAGGEVAAAE